MGGVDTLRAVHSVRMKGIGHANLLEQSERPEGPYLVAYTEFTQLRDLERQRLATVENTRSVVGPPDGFEVESLVGDGVALMRVGERTFPGMADAVGDAADSLTFGPERVLLHAREASDLAWRDRQLLQGVEHEVVAFTLGGVAVRLFLNSYTSLPTAVEWVRDYPDGFWSIWGDVTTRVEYSLWFLEPGGLLLPHQWTETRNGMPYRDRTMIEVEVNADTSAADFEVTAELRAGFEARRGTSPDSAQLGASFRGAPETPEVLAPGITQIRGMWNVAVVEQDGGIVVIEAPISSAYSEKVIAWVEAGYPGKPIVAVVTTSDAWPHFAGIREYAARGIRIEAFALTIPLLDRLIAAPRTLRPDLQQQAGAQPRYESVAATVELGGGANRMLLLPIRGEGGERMLAVYFPEHRLLYASDLIQPGQGDAFFMPSYLAEVEALVQREGLAVETVFAMHLGPTPWSQVIDALAAVRAGDLRP